MICPMLSMAEGRVAKCRENECMWWVHGETHYASVLPLEPFTEPGHCVVKDLPNPMEEKDGKKKE